MFYRNGPDNINLERAARDLRELTCLNMEGLPGIYDFFFVQGESGMYFKDFLPIVNFQKTQEAER